MCSRNIEVYLKLFLTESYLQFGCTNFQTARAHLIPVMRYICFNPFLFSDDPPTSNIIWNPALALIRSSAETNWPITAHFTSWIRTFELRLLGFGEVVLFHHPFITIWTPNLWKYLQRIKIVDFNNQLLSQIELHLINHLLIMALIHSILILIPVLVQSGLKVKAVYSVPHPRNRICNAHRRDRR